LKSHGKSSRILWTLFKPCSLPPCATRAGSRLPLLGVILWLLVLSFFLVRSYADILPDYRVVLDSIDAMLRLLEELSDRIEGLLEE